MNVFNRTILTDCRFDSGISGHRGCSASYSE